MSADFPQWVRARVHECAPDHAMQSVEVGFLRRTADIITEYERALEKIAAAEGCQPGHVAYLSKTAMSMLAERALERGEQVSA